VRSPHVYRRPVENAYLERVRDQRLKRELLAMLGVVLVLGGGLLAYTWIHVETLRVGYRIGGLEDQINTLEERERALRLEAAHRAHPARIQERARLELGMRAPSLDETLFYEELVP